METAAMNNTYFVTAPHTVEQCMGVLDEVKEKGDKFLSNTKFGCLSGHHISYTFLDAPSEEAVRKLLPDDIKVNAKIEKVDSFTAKQIEDFHKTVH